MRNEHAEAEIPSAQGGGWHPTAGDGETGPSVLVSTNAL